MAPACGLAPVVTPIIVDSTELVEEILAQARHQREPTLLTAVDRGEFRLYAAIHVAEEVPRKIRAQFERRRASPTDGLAIWQSLYLPAIYFVDVTGVPVTEEMSGLEVEDPSDLPTAQLKYLLGNVISLSSDNDLIRHGFARPQRWPVAWEAERRSESAAKITAAGIPFVVPGAVGVEIVRAATRRAGSVGGFVAVVGLGGLGYWGIRRFQIADERVKAAALAFVDKLFNYATAAVDRHQNATQFLNQARIPPVTWGSVTSTKIAEVLAWAPEAMSAKAICRQLWDDDSAVPTRFFEGVRGDLQRLPAFSQVSRHRWQLGRLLEESSKGAD